jgi:3-deoxy-D-manno-octulosonic-acid transferase
MSDPSLSLAANFSRYKGDWGGKSLMEMPPRPDGTVVWVRATDPDQLNALSDLSHQLQVDGDKISLIVSLPLANDEAVQSPRGYGQIGEFLTHWRPSLVLWLDADLDPSTLFELKKSAIPCMLVSATKNVLRLPKNGWIPGLLGAMLRQFVSIMVVDKHVAMQVIRGGADASRVETLGPFESAPAALPHFEEERQDITKTLDARSIWLAADADLSEIDQIATAHHQASRRAHRLLLIVTLRNESQVDAAVDKLRNAGFSVAQRSEGEEPGEATQVYVADIEGEMGLWYRIAPITYLGGSLSGGPCRDPFEAATLGSAVLHGPDVAPFDAQIKRLAAADACVSLKSFEDLGDTVEMLLSPDKTALIVHAAWDVTSRGADATNRIAEAVIAQLDQMGR